MNNFAALYVISNGPYSEIECDLWDESRDARMYKGPLKVIAHPPCERWGRYWGGGPMLHGTPKQKILGDDKGCFSSALASVRMYGGVLEHPEASHAFKRYGLPIPKIKGKWTDPDIYGGRSCCVAQGNYGHRAQKMTWLYGLNINFKELVWGKTPGRDLLDEGFHSKEERARLIKTGRCQRLSQRQRKITPNAFRDLLISLLEVRRE